MESKVQQYLKKKKSQTPQKESNEMGEQSPLPMEDLMQIFQKLRGKNAKPPSEEYLIELIKPLIPKVEDGKAPTRDELVALIKPLIPEVKDGITPKRGKDYFNDVDIKYLLSLATPKKGTHYDDGKDGKPGRAGRDAIMPNLRELAITAINILETFEGEDRLDAKAIKNLEKIIRQIVSQETINFGGPGVIFHDDTLEGDGTPGGPLRVVGGAGANFETPVGLIDGVNADFVVTNVPKAVILNGATYFENDGYTFNSGTMTITMLITPVIGSTLRSLY